jgi:hypothetical protein
MEEAMTDTPAKRVTPEFQAAVNQAAHLAETRLPADMRAAGIWIAWEEQR